MRDILRLASVIDYLKVKNMSGLRNVVHLVGQDDEKAQNAPSLLHSLRCSADALETTELMLLDTEILPSLPSIVTRPYS
jgi:hypothetical protein